MTKIKNALKNFGYKKIIIILLAIILLVVIIVPFFRSTTLNTYYNANHLSHGYDFASSDVVSDLKTYSNKMIEYKDKGLTATKTEETIITRDMNGYEISKDDSVYGSIINDYHKSHPESDIAYMLNTSNSISFTSPSSDAGLYYLAVDYYDFSENIDTTQIKISINGEIPFYEAMTIGLPSNWEFIQEEFALDRYQNEIQPSSSKIKEWKKHELNDNKGSNPSFFAFYLEAGDEITIEHVNNDVIIGQIYFVLPEEITTYQSYLSNYQNASIKDTQISVSARDMKHRTDPSIRLRSETDPSNMYYDTQFLKLNVIYGESWQNGGQRVTYDVEVPESGLYNLSFKYRQYMIKDMPVFRKILVNGSVPYDELEAYAFPYTTNFLNRTLVDENEKPLYVYLEKGVNEISLEAVNYPYRELIEVLSSTMQNIQNLALEIKKYTSGGNDQYRDWDIEEYFPNAKSDILAWADLLESTYQKYMYLGSKGNPAEISNLLVAVTRLRNLTIDINRLPSKMVQFSDGDSSVNQVLGLTMQNLMRSNIELERMIVHSEEESIPTPFSNVFVSFWEGLKRLVLSFTNNQYGATGSTDTELVIWVNHPRQYIEIMQSLIDQKYTGEYKVTLSQMPDQNKLILANASGDAPDMAIGVDHWIPYDFAIRDASLDLRQFAGYEELVKKFSKGAMIPYAFEEGIFGLPETQNFWVTYYRKDILESIGINDIPQTWDEIIAILPLLQSYGMNYYLPISMYQGLKPFVATLPFIYQFGGRLYTDNGIQTAINDENTLKGITLMSDLFTKYNIDKYVASFYNNFRYGTTPIGISDLATYLLLQTAAAELDGLWGMDLHPGVKNEDGDIIRYAASGAQSSMIMSSTNKPNEAWNFLKWWMSTEVQAEFAMILQTTYGKAYFWNTANLEAFEKISMPAEYKSIVLKQWEYALEASRIPGTYMVEREISNAWTAIVYDGVNPRKALDDAVRISNREIMYKMEEFGYTYQGTIIKDYVVPDIYNIDYWLTEVDK